MFCKTQASSLEFSFGLCGGALVMNALLKVSFNLILKHSYRHFEWLGLIYTAHKKTFYTQGHDRRSFDTSSVSFFFFCLFMVCSEVPFTSLIDPIVFCGFFTIDLGKYDITNQLLKNTMKKYWLSFTYSTLVAQRWCIAELVWSHHIILPLMLSTQRAQSEHAKFGPQVLYLMFSHHHLAAPGSFRHDCRIIL